MRGSTGCPPVGCGEERDQRSGDPKYKPTGKNEWSVAIAPERSIGQALITALHGSRDRARGVNPVNGGCDRLGDAAQLKSV
jgi:hypothetical protein